MTPAESTQRSRRGFGAVQEAGARSPYTTTPSPSRAPVPWGPSPALGLEPGWDVGAPPARLAEWLGPPAFEPLDRPVHQDIARCHRTLRRESPRLPILLSSGYPEDEALARIDGGEAFAFLQKPYGTEALRRRVQELLEGPGAPGASGGRDAH